MAGIHSQDEEGGLKKARIEIIPLIDVIFFLLATFVLFTLSLDKIGSLPLQTPIGDPNPKPPPEHLLSILVSEEGTYYWTLGSGLPELIPAGEIAPRLVDYHNKYQDHARVLVRGDRRAKFGPAATLIDEVRLAGIEQVALETRIAPTEKNFRE